MENEGCFITFPIKHDNSNNLGKSCEITLQRFKALERRLIARPDMYDEYKKFMREYQDLKHMREVTNHLWTISANQSFYFPYHPK